MYSKQYKKAKYVYKLLPTASESYRMQRYIQGTKEI
jgi:hypothetical protein